MDARALANVLKHTFAGDETQRRAAEDALKRFQRQPGYQSTLLQLITQNNFPLPIRQSATILLKNIIVHNWSVRKAVGPNSVLISDKDRGIIKQNLLESILQQNRHQIRVQLLECLLHVCRTDFPAKYPHLLSDIMKNIHSKNPQRIYGALCSLRQVFKNYHFRAQKDRVFLPRLVEATFPTLIQVLNALLSSNPNQDSYEMIRMPIKIFRIATYLSIPDYLRKPEHIEPWVNAIIKVIELPVVGVKQMPRDQKELKAIPQIKCKKWALQCVFNIHKRFGQEVLIQDKALKPFARMFDQKFSKPFLGAVWGVLEARTKGMPVTDRITQTCFQYIGSIINHAHLYKFIRPRLKFLIVDAVLGCLCLSQEDLMQWREDPAEYIRKDMDIMEEFDDPKISASEFLTELIRIRTSDALPLTMNAMEAIFQQYAQSPPERRDYRRKEAAMRMLQSLSKLLLSEEKYTPHIEKTIITHILPEFKSRLGFLKARACAVVGAYMKMEYKNQKAFAASIRSVCECLTSTELPLKLQAVKAMSRVVKNKSVVEHIKPHLAQVFHEYFRLINDIPNEEVVETLEILIAHVKDEVGPFAVEIAKRMTGLFLNIINNSNPEDDESAFTALQCLRVLNTLLHVLAPLKDNSEVFAKLCLLYQPVIERCMRGEDAHEFLEDVLDLIGALVSFCSQMTPFLWSLIPRIIGAYKSFALDHVQNVVVCLGKYIAYAPKGLSERVNLIKEMLGMAAWTFYPSYPQGQGPANSMVSEIDFLVAGQYAGKMISMMLIHLGPKIVPLLPDISKLLIKKLSSTIKLHEELQRSNDEDAKYNVAKTGGLKVIILESIAAAMYVNPALFLQKCSQMGCLKQVFKVWMDSREDLKHDSTCLGISLMGLMSVSLLPIDSLPKELLGNDKVMLHLLNAGVGQLTDYKTLEEKEANEEDTEDEDSEQEIQEFEDIDNSKDAIGEEDIEQMKGLAEKIRECFQEHGAQNDEYLQEFFEPIQEIDKFEFFARCTGKFSQINPQAYQAWISVLSQQQKQHIQLLVNEGQRRAGEAKKKDP